MSEGISDDRFAVYMPDKHSDRFFVTRQRVGKLPNEKKGPALLHQAKFRKKTSKKADSAAGAALLRGER